MYDLLWIHQTKKHMEKKKKKTENILVVAKNEKDNLEIVLFNVLYLIYLISTEAEM